MEPSETARAIDTALSVVKALDLPVEHATVLQSSNKLSLRLLPCDCRRLVLAMVTAWRWEPGDQLPNGEHFGCELLRTLRAGPPWPTIDEVHARLDP